MKIGTANINKPFQKTQKMFVEIKTTRQFKIRCFFGVFFLKVGCLILGIGVIDIDAKSEDMNHDMG